MNYLNKTDVRFSYASGTENFPYCFRYITSKGETGVYMTNCMEKACDFMEEIKRHFCNAEFTNIKIKDMCFSFDRSSPPDWFENAKFYACYLDLLKEVKND